MGIDGKSWKFHGDFPCNFSIFILPHSLRICKKEGLKLQAKSEQRFQHHKPHLRYLGDVFPPVFHKSLCSKRFDSTTSQPIIPSNGTSNDGTPIPSFPYKQTWGELFCHWCVCGFPDGSFEIPRMLKYVEIHHWFLGLFPSIYPFIHTSLWKAQLSSIRGADKNPAWWQRMKMAPPLTSWVGRHRCQGPLDEAGITCSCGSCGSGHACLALLWRLAVGVLSETFRKGMANGILEIYQQSSKANTRGKTKLIN